MEFIGKANVVVWNKEANKRLCKFARNGSFETEDEYIIGKLKALGYKSSDEEVPGPKPTQVEELPEPILAQGEDPATQLYNTVLEDLSLEELKEHATENGIKFSYNIGREKLLEKVRAHNDS